jgi:signal transduction histidine kinase/FixJ family two-component response regulator
MISRLLWLAAICVLSPSVIAAADNTLLLQLDGARDEYPLGRFVDILEDPEGRLTIEQVSSPEWTPRFQRSHSDEPNFGMTSSVYWVRLLVYNRSGYGGHWWLQQGYPNTQYLSLFLPDGDGGFERRDGGILQPFNERDLAYHLIIFDLPAIPADGETLYLRFENGSNMVMSLSLWRPKALVEHSWHRRLLLGLFLGCLLIMVAYNGFLWLLLRDSTYLWFLLFIAGVTITEATSKGLGAQYLWPGAPWINAYAIQGAAGFGFFFLLLFTMRFLDTRQRLPGMHRVLQGGLAAWLALGLLLPWVSYGFGVRIAFVLILLTCLLVLIAGLWSLRRGYGPARYLLLGAMALLASLVVMVLTRIGLLPSNPVTQQIGYQIGTVVFILSLSFALAARIRRLERERDGAQLQALQASAAHQQLVEEQNIRLEQQVEQRTQDLIQAKEVAETANRAKSSFLATMSHELRTPLNVILGYARILASRAGDSETRRNLEVIGDSGNHLLTLLDDLLDLARVESGRVELSRAEFGLEPFVTGLTVMFRSQASDKGLEFSTRLGDRLPDSLVSDERRLRQVMINLLGNALKFTEQGGIELGISLYSDAGGGEVKLLFEVIDTGRGIAPEDRQDIFQPFQQVGSGLNRAGGSGLGLAVSSKLVELLGGRLQVDSRVGDGSRFWFVLAVRGERRGGGPLAEPESPSQRGGAVPVLKGNGRRLLIVDDHAPNRRLLVDIFADSGFDLREAADGVEALAVSEDYAPDVVIIDLVMPGMDGLTLIRHLRERESVDHRPIIANSASAFDSDRQAALAAGADRFLAKPLDPQQLLDTVRELLELDLVSGEVVEDDASPSLETLTRLDELLRCGDIDRIDALLSGSMQEQPGLRRFCDELLVLSRGYRLRELRDALMTHRGLEG